MFKLALDGSLKRNACFNSNTVHDLQLLGKRSRLFTVGRFRSSIGPFQSKQRLDSYKFNSRLSVFSAASQMSDSVIDEKTKNTLAEEAVVWAGQHGLVMGPGGQAPESHLVHAPLTVLPTPLPASSYNQGVSLAEACNLLVYNISQDTEYIENTLKEVCKSDPFTGRLMDIFQQTRDSAQRDDVTLNILRSDYMLDVPSGGILQVELNTIASSFGCLSTLVSRMHRYILDRNPQLQSMYPLDGLPENTAMESIAEAMAEAVNLMTEDTTQQEEEGDSSSSVVLMVVQPGERNSFDQQWLALRLWEAHRVRLIRKSLAQVVDEGVLKSDDSLWIDDQRITLVYFRAGYTPDDYPTEKEWEGRLLLEKSKSVKCPNVACHLAGTKKVQQDLARPGALTRFLTQEDANRMSECFAGLWSLTEGEGDSTPEEVDAVIAQALAEPDAFVLKPQREGGGNNLYGQEMCDRLQNKEGLEAYILMQLIRPPEQQSLMVREGKCVEVPSLSELGIYSTYLRKGQDVMIDRPSGHLLRTKSATSNEGGVAAGFAVLDSPILVD